MQQVNYQRRMLNKVIFGVDHLRVVFYLHALICMILFALLDNINEQEVAA